MATDFFSSDDQARQQGFMWWLLILGIILFSQPARAITVAAEQPAKYIPLLAKQRVGLVVNQSSRAFDQHLVDYLLTREVNVTAIFAPEHGFRGDKGAGEKIANQVDPHTGLPVFSLYGKTRKPSAEMLTEVDVLVFDIQDVGARFYTYISTLHYVMEAAAETGKTVVVLDRPNPNIMHIDGPVLDPVFRSFVGMHPIPVLHGMTVGELAKMINGEGWLDTDKNVELHVIPVSDYSRQSEYQLPILPSPNLPNQQAILLYPSLCFFEPTIMSIGRGTAFPFQVLGHTDIKLGDFAFTPISMPSSAPTPKLQDKKVKGLDLRLSDIRGIDLSLLVSAYQMAAAQQTPFFTSTSFFDKLAGSDSLRLALESGLSAAEIEAEWRTAISEFKQQRQPYLLYPNRLREND